jgi:hypothetical protein
VFYRIFTFHRYFRSGNPAKRCSEAIARRTEDMASKTPAMAITALLILLGFAASTAEAATLRISLNKAEVIRLDGTASVVLIANPEIADVVLEQNKLLFVLGKRPGETRLFVYDDSGRRMLERDIVVVPQGERAVTVTRAVKATEYSCDPRCVSTSDDSPGGQTAAASPAAPAAAPAPAAAAPQAQAGPKNGEPAPSYKHYQE